MITVLDGQRQSARDAVATRLREVASTRSSVSVALVLGCAGLVLPLVWWSAVLLGREMTATIGRSRLGPDPLMLMLLVVPAAMLLFASRLPAGVPRTHVASGSSLVAAAFLAAAAVAPTRLNALLLLAAVVSAGLASTLHLPLLFDLFAPTGRRWALALTAACHLAAPVAAIAAIEVVGLAGLTWRVDLLALAVIAAVGAALTWRIADPGTGAFEATAVGAVVPCGEASAGGVGLPPLTQVVSQLFTSRSTRPILEGGIVLGALTTVWAVFIPNLLDEAWQVPRGGRFAVVSAAAGVAIVLTLTIPALLSRREATPASVLRAAAGFVDAAGVCVVIGAFVTVFGLAVVELVLGIGIGMATLPLLWHALMTIVPPATRLHAAALLGGAGFLGIMQGFFLVGAIDVRFGASWGVAIGGPLLFAGGSAFRRAALKLDEDADAVIDAAVEEQTIKQLRAAQPLPLLVCRNIDFSYGSLQVLFGVNLTVEDGEMVALLGTNGAGKSTLLRAVSGLAIPQRGSIRLLGDDITFLSAEQRVGAGIIQIPGGRGVFGPLTVVENLRLHGYTLGRQRAKIDAGVDDVFAAFPGLAERRNQPASTLSGGEQQMLALGKALVVRPRVLLIDELSLGLAPKVVAELLEMVRAINAAGSAVVLVEQSVNIALTLAHHAYFMEKGEIRFDGRAADLLDRGDLLRSVFLGGAVAASAAGVVGAI